MIRTLTTAAGGLLLGIALVLGAQGRGTPALALTNCDTTEAGVTAEEQAFLALLNQERAKQVPPAPALKFSPNLNRAAAWKSVDSLVKWDHTDSLGRSPATRAVQCGYATSMGENLANGFASAQAVFNAWMGSQGHRTNMLNRLYVVAGVAQHGGSWTLDLGAFDDSGQANAPAQPTATPTLPAFPATSTPVPPTPQPTPVPQAPLHGVSLLLDAGLNLVTYAGGEQSPAGALSRMGIQPAAVYEWDATTGRWLRYFPGAPAYVNTLGKLRPGRAYFIVMPAAATWIY